MSQNLLDDQSKLKQMLCKTENLFFLEVVTGLGQVFVPSTDLTDLIVFQRVEKN